MIDEQMVLWVWKQISGERYIPSKWVKSALLALRSVAPRRFDVLQMRAQAKSFQEIGQTLNVSRQRAKQIFDSALTQVTRLALLHLTAADVCAASQEDL